MGAVGRMGALGLRFGPDSGELGLIHVHIFLADSESKGCAGSRKIRPRYNQAVPRRKRCLYKRLGKGKVEGRSCGARCVIRGWMRRRSEGPSRKVGKRRRDLERSVMLI